MPNADQWFLFTHLKWDECEVILGWLSPRFLFVSGPGVMMSWRHGRAWSLTTRSSWGSTRSSCSPSMDKNPSWGHLRLQFYFLILSMQWPTWTAVCAPENGPVQWFGTWNLDEFANKNLGVINDLRTYNHEHSSTTKSQVSDFDFSFSSITNP